MEARKVLLEKVTIDLCDLQEGNGLSRHREEHSRQRDGTSEGKSVLYEAEERSQAGWSRHF